MSWKNKQISLLFGAGISIPAGIPNGCELTDEIFNKSKEWYRDTLQYSKKSPEQGPHYYDNLQFDGIPVLEYTPKIIEFIRMIKEEIESYYKKVAKKSIEANYEEIYDTAHLIYDAITQINDNSIMTSLIDKLMNNLKPLKDSGDRLMDLELLCKESMRYIKSNLIHYLHPKKTTEYLSILFDISNNVSVPINIFTLNHDSILECFLKSDSIEFTDGFTKVDSNGVRFWKPQLFKNMNHIKLLKLHGSLNWHIIMYSYKGSNRTAGYVQFINYPDGRDVILKDETIAQYYDPPIFLTGYNNKFLATNYGIYLRLYHHFQSLLDDTNVLIISGYSFGDNGINLRLIDWFINDHGRKMIVIDPNLDNLIEHAKGAMHLRLNDFDNKRLQFIEKGIDQVNIDEIIDALDQ